MTGQPFRDDQIVYGAKDVEYLLQIRQKQLPNIAKYKLENVVDLENKAVLAFSDIEYNGLDIDKDKWEVIAKQSERESIAMRSELDDMLVADPRLSEFISTVVQTDLFTDFDDIRKVNVKWTSPKKVLAVFQKLVPDLENVHGKKMYK